MPSTLSAQTHTNPDERESIESRKVNTLRLFRFLDPGNMTSQYFATLHTDLKSSACKVSVRLIRSRDPKETGHAIL